MGRLRKEKGKSFADSNTKNKPLSTSTLTPNNDDIQLFGNVNPEDGLITGPGSNKNNDASLSGDVSKLLKELKGEVSTMTDVHPPQASKEKQKQKKQKQKGNQTKNINAEDGQTDLHSAPTPKKKEKEKAPAKEKQNKEPKASTVHARENKSVITPTELSSSIAKTSSSNSKSTTRLVFAATPHWHTALPPLSSSSSSSSSNQTQLTPTQLTTLHSRAEKLHAQDVESFHSSSASGGGEAAFLSKIISSGTLSDRLSALTLMVQSSPLHNTRALETLSGMAERGKGQGGREESLKALRCIVDWWVGGGVGNSKLKYFRDQPLTHPDVTDEYLVMWYFEDWLKKWFFKVLHTLETLNADPLPYVRTQAINLTFTLLREKSEQEHNLLRLGVNKLGDSTKQICAKTSHHILTLLQSHPAMKPIVVSAISDLVFKPSLSHSTGTSLSATGQGKRIVFGDTEEEGKKNKEKEKERKKERPSNPHLWYYATITLNQIVLTTAEKDREVALILVDLYFRMFQAILGSPASSQSDEQEQEQENGEVGGDTKVDKHGRIYNKKKNKGKKDEGKKKKSGGDEGGFGEVEDGDSKLVSALLTGVRRAVGFVKAVDERLTKHMDTLFKITHTSTFNISLQALVLIQQVIAGLASSTTTGEKEIDRYYRTLYESLFDSRLAASGKQAMYLNLFVRSVKAEPGVLASFSSTPSTSSTHQKKGKGKKKKHANDDSEKAEDDSRISEGGIERLDRVRALVRRFVQVLVTGGTVTCSSSGSSGGGGAATEFVAGGLYLLGELFSSVPGLREMLDACPLSPASLDSAESKKEVGYDPRKREPKYAHAGASPLWELMPLVHHYHPTISLHARQLVSGEPLSGASADLGLNTLTAFLDRFVFKNPKKIKVGDEGAGKNLGRGTSAMQPAASSRVDGGVKLVKGELGREGEGRVKRVNEGGWWRKGEDQVPVDEVFYARYFKAKDERERKVKKKRGEKDDEEEEEESEGQEDESEDEEEVSEAGDQNEEDEDGDGEFDEDDVWAAMQRTMPKMQGDSDASDIDIDEDDEDLDISADEDGSGSHLSEDGQSGDEEDEFAERSDNEDLISLSGSVDLPSEFGLGDHTASEDSEDEWGGIEPKLNKKRKRGGDERKAQRKKLKSLPTFATWEDYAALIEGQPEDNI